MDPEITVDRSTTGLNNNDPILLVAHQQPSFAGNTVAPALNTVVSTSISNNNNLVKTQDNKLISAQISNVLSDNDDLSNLGPLSHRVVSQSHVNYNSG